MPSRPAYSPVVTLTEQLKMPANSNRFNRFFALLLFQFATFSSVWAQLPELSSRQLSWLGDQIFTNECNRDQDCLTGWNEGEQFPSLGIGHFIWIPAGQQAPFEETFPALIDFMLTEGLDVPDWIAAARHSGAPWQSRSEFYAQFAMPKMGQLRRFLYATRNEQAVFIARRLWQTLPELTAGLPAAEVSVIEQRFESVARAAPPYGLYALIDYLHFKGSGLRVSERYQGQGWGLLQVLQNMEPAATDLDSFINSAARMLERRVRNAPEARNEQRWLAGWTARLQTYRPAAEN